MTNWRPRFLVSVWWPSVFWAVAFLCALGCESEAARERRQLEADRDVLTPRVAAAEASVARLRAQYQQHSDNLRGVQEDTTDYMMNHKMAMAALAAGYGGAKIAVDKTSFSDEARTIGGAIAILAAVYAVDHMPEITEVGNRLLLADTRIRAQQAAMVETEQQWRAENADLERLRIRMDEIRQRLTALK